MAHCATPGSPGTRKRTVPARTVVAAIVACIVAFSAFFWAHSVMTAQAITFNGMRPPYPTKGPSTLGDVAGVQSPKDWAATASSAVALRTSDAQLHYVSDVGARTYLRIVVHVRDLNGTPVRRQQVVVVWRSRGILSVESAITGADGNASLLHWVPGADRGETVVVAAWTDTPSWSNGTYAWFIPR